MRQQISFGKDKLLATDDSKRSKEISKYLSTKNSLNDKGF